MGLNAYVMFVHGAGGTEFFRRYGRRPNMKKDNDSIGALFQEISEDDRSYYKMLTKGVALPPRTIVFKNADVSGSSHYRTTGTNAPANDPAGGRFDRNSPRNPEFRPNAIAGGRRRSANLVANDSREGRHELDKSKAIQPKMSGSRQSDHYPPAEWAPGVFGRRTRCTRFVLLGGRHSNGFRQDAGRQEVPVVHRTSDRKAQDNPFAKLSVDLHNFQFISIYNYVYHENQNNTKTVYPAEIAVISFSLKKGVFDKEVIRVNFPLRDKDDNLVDRSKREFFNGYPNEAVEEKLHKTYEERKARGGYVNNMGYSFKDALLWLCDKFDRPGRINVLDPSSDTLRTIYHMFEVYGSFSQKKKIDTIRFNLFDDIVTMIMDCSYPRAVSTFDISNYFTKQHTFNQTQICCSDHKDPNQTVHGFFVCPVFAALSKIQMFFDFCDEVGVCGFSKRSVQNIHDYVFFQEHWMHSDRSKIGLYDTAILPRQTGSISSHNCDTNFGFYVMNDEQWNEFFTLDQVSSGY